MPFVMLQLNMNKKGLTPPKDGIKPSMKLGFM